MLLVRRSTRKLNESASKKAAFTNNKCFCFELKRGVSDGNYP